MEIRQFTFLLESLKYRRRVYLDHNATTPVSPRVRKGMNRVLLSFYGNPSSVYRQGRKANELMENARRQVAEALGASASSIYFTACATESNNAVLKSLASQKPEGRNKIISTPIEHPSVLRTLEFLKTRGIDVEYCQVDNHGMIDPEEMGRRIDDRTLLVCCMLANNDIGSIQDLHTVCRIAHAHETLVLADCVQAFGKIPINLEEMDVDYASFSAHKLYGPKGIGALYVKEGRPLTSFIHGGGQESGMRAGTEALHNIVGFGLACTETDRHLAESVRILRLKNELKKGLKDIFPGCSFNSPEENCLPNTLHVRFPGLSNSAVLGMLDARGISVSAGSACSSKKKSISPTLQAIGLSGEEAHESLRISLGSSTSRKDIRYTLRNMRAIRDGKVRHVALLSPSDLDAQMKEGEELTLIDVRPRMLYTNIPPIQGALLIPFSSLNRHIREIPPDHTIVLICQRGNLSYLAAHYLIGKGFKKSYSLSGGMVEWEKEN